MATPRELKTVWQVRFFDASRSPQETTVSLSKAEYPTVQDASKEAVRLKALYRHTDQFDPWVHDYPGQKVRSQGPTISEAVERYCDEKREAGRRGEKRGWSEGTLTRYRSTLDQMARHVGMHRLVRDLTENDLSSWVHRDGLAEETRRTYRGMVQAFVRWLREERLSDVEPPPALHAPRKLPAYVSVEELGEICRAHARICKGKDKENDDPNGKSRAWMCDAFEFAFWQALRKREITALRVGGVDLRRGVMRVGDSTFVPKGRDEKIIPLAAPARSIAERWMGGRKPGARLFDYRSPDRLSKAFTAAAREALPHRPDVTLHSVRHGRCVDLLEKGVPIYKVQRFMRHKSIDATMRYTQIVPGSLGKAIKGLDEEGLARNGR